MILKQHLKNMGLNMKVQNQQGMEIGNIKVVVQIFNKLKLILELIIPW